MSFDWFIIYLIKMDEEYDSLFFIQQYLVFCKLFLDVVFSFFVDYFIINDVLIFFLFVELYELFIRVIFVLGLDWLFWMNFNISSFC